LRTHMIGLWILVMLLMVCSRPGAAQPMALADAQGWSGPGWYITDAKTSAHALILFEGPHALQSRCVETYDRLYSPIGGCRFLEAKPIEPARSLSGF